MAFLCEILNILTGFLFDLLLVSLASTTMIETATIIADIMFTISLLMANRFLFLGFCLFLLFLYLSERILIIPQEGNKLCS